MEKKEINCLENQLKAKLMKRLHSEQIFSSAKCPGEDRHEDKNFQAILKLRLPFLRRIRKRDK